MGSAAMPRKTAAGPLTVTVAKAAATDYGFDKIIKAAELIRCVPAEGRTLSLPAMKAFNLMLSTVGAGGFEDRLYTISKRMLRGSHESNDRLPDILDELQRTLFRFAVVLPDGEPAVMTVALLAARIEPLRDRD